MGKQPRGQFFSFSHFKRNILVGAIVNCFIGKLVKFVKWITRKLYSAQECSDNDLILFLDDKRKLCRDFRAETYISANIISEDSKKESKTASGSKVSL